MRKVYYIYNPRTQTYDRIYQPSGNVALSILRRLFFFGMGLGGGSFHRIIADFSVRRPRRNCGKKKQPAFKAQYNVLAENGRGYGGVAGCAAT